MSLPDEGGDEANGEVVNASHLGESLGTRLKEMRLQRGLSQRELAVGLASKSMVSQIESGKARPSRELLERFAERLGVAVEELLPAMQDDQQRLADYRQAQALHMLGHHEQALPLLLGCLGAPHVTWSLRVLHMQAATCSQVLKRHEEAREHYEIALREAVRELEQAEVVRCRFRLGEVAFACAEWNVALHEWELASRELAGAEPPEDEPDLGCELLLNLGRVQHRLGNPKEALRHYRDADRLLRTRKHPLRKEAEATFGIGVSCFRLKRYRVAEAYLRRACDLYETARDRRAALEARLELAQLLRAIGQAASALDLLEEGLQAVEASGDSELGARMVCERAAIWQEQGRQAEAVSFLASVLHRWPHSFYGKGVMHNCLSELYAEEQRLGEALLEAEQAVAELQGEGQQAELLKSYQLLTRLHKQLGDYKRASECVVRVNELMNRQINGVGLLA